MKKNIFIFLLMLLLSNYSYADCFDDLIKDKNQICYNEPNNSYIIKISNLTEEYLQTGKITKTKVYYDEEKLYSFYDSDEAKSVKMLDFLIVRFHNRKK